MTIFSLFFLSSCVVTNTFDVPALTDSSLTSGSGAEVTVDDGTMVFQSLSVDNITAVDVNPGSITITFNNNIDPDTVSTSTLYITDTAMGTTVAGKRSVSGSTITFTPYHPMRPNADYVFTLTTGVTTLAGGTIGTNITQSFTTEDVFLSYASYVTNVASTTTLTISGNCTKAAGVTLSATVNGGAPSGGTTDNCATDGYFSFSHTMAVSDATYALSVTVTNGGVSTTSNQTHTACNGLTALPAASTPPTVGANKEISTIAHLVDVANDLGASYVLANDLDLACYDWDPIEVFTGSFDGQGYTISNMIVDQSGAGSTALASTLGLFGETSGATVSNLYLVNSSVISFSDAGTVFGENAGLVVGLMTGGSMSDVFASGDVGGAHQNMGLIAGQATATVPMQRVGTNGQVRKIGVAFGLNCGGLVGYAFDDVDIQDSYAISFVNGFGIGGLAGTFGTAPTGGASIQDSWTYAFLSPTGNSNGGLIGSCDSDAAGTTILRTYTWGGLNGGTAVRNGGLIGSSRDCTVDDSYAYFDIYGADLSGGFIGRQWCDAASAACVVTKSYAYGDVSTASGANIGGFIGGLERGTIRRSGSYGDVTGAATSDQVGGFVGVLNPTALTAAIVVEDCFTQASTVVGDDRVGGFLGYGYENGGDGAMGVNEPQVDNSYTLVTTVTGNTNTSEFAGESIASIALSYYNAVGGSAPESSGAGGASYDFDGNTQAATQAFTTWDFASIWTWETGASLYPTHQ